MAEQTITRYKQGTNILETPKIKLTEIPNNIKYYKHTTTDNDRLTTLAWKYLGNAQYYWLLAEINNIMSSNYILGRLEAGIEIDIPEIKILDYLGEKSEL